MMRERIKDASYSVTAYITIGLIHLIIDAGSQVVSSRNALAIIYVIPLHIIIIQVCIQLKR